MSVDRAFSLKIRRLSLLCAILVVVIHSLTMPIGGSFFQDFVIRSLTQGAVPFFFVVSGFFYYNSFELNWKCATKKLMIRLKTLLIPFFLWVVIALLSAHIFRDRPFPSTWSGLVWDIGFPGFWPHILPPLWYVMMLLYMVILGLPIGFAVRKFGLLFTVACAIWYMLQLRAWVYLHAACFFSLGGWVAMNRDRVRSFFDRLIGRRFAVVVMAAMALACFRVIPIRSAVAGSVYYCAVVEILYALLFAVSIWKGYEYLSCNGLPARCIDWMSQYTFFIYCSHYLFVVAPINICMGKAFFMFGCSLAVAVLTKRFLPRGYSVLTGGR